MNVSVVLCSAAAEAAAAAITIAASKSEADEASGETCVLVKAESLASKPSVSVFIS